MAFDINNFWEILKVIQGLPGDVTTALESVSKNEKTIAEKLFSNVIDQKCFASADYNRIRKFLRDIYAAHRSVTTFQANISDIYQIPNDQLDELFQSFGYNYSTSLRNNTNNPPLDKINLFLDLVNLYKVKGTPQALIDVLKYYGIIDVDLYELSLQYDDREFKDNSVMFFKGKKIAGTTTDVSPIYLPFNLLTETDPHWHQSESKIRQLLSTRKINFPSQSPYFAIKPLFDEEATDASTGILSRKVQDQYWTWQDTGIIPTRDSVATITGDQVSLLELYLASIYMFNSVWIVGAYAPRFVCYDGTNINDSTLIMDEFRTITETKVLSRADLLSRWNQYINLFTRSISTNFLQNYSDAGMILNILNPTFKANLDLLATDAVTTLGTLLNDLGNWVRNNISFGFINMSYILFGLDSLFSQLRSIIEFFKPYRARLIPLEMIQLRNRLFNSIVVEDKFEHTLNTYFVDFLTGNSIPCCSSNDILCTSDDATSFIPIYSREHYDCGSTFDTGAVTDASKELFIEYHDIIRDNLRCPISDTTGFVVSEVISQDTNLAFSTLIPIDSTSVDVTFDNSFVDSNYIPNISIYNGIDSNPSQFGYTVTQKTTSGFNVLFSGQIPTDNYVLYYSLTAIDSTCCGVTNLTSGLSQQIVNFASPMPNNNYVISATLTNITDLIPYVYAYNIINKTVNGFTIEFSSPIDSNFYYLEWIISERENTQSTPIPYNTTSMVVTIPTPTTADYSVLPVLYNSVDNSASQYLFVITNKVNSEFTILFSSPIDSTNFMLDWYIETKSNLDDSLYLFSQTGGFRDFDSEGTFDCSHGFDVFQIRIDDIFSGYLLQEDGSYLLQEDNSRILL